MAVRLVPGGLQSYAPGADARTITRTIVGGRSGGGSSRADNPELARVASERARIIEQERLAKQEKQRLVTQSEQERQRQTEQERQRQLQQGGYFINPATGLGTSSADDLSQRNFIRTATAEDIKRKEIIKEEGIIYGRKGVEEYNKEIEKLNKERKELEKIYPREAVLDIKTGRLKSQAEITKIDIGGFSFTPKDKARLFVDPKGKPIKDIQKYYDEHDIPYSIERPVLDAKEFQELISGDVTPIYDLTTLPKEKLVIEKKRFRQDELSPFYYKQFPEAGTVMEITPLDVTLALTPALKGGFLYGQAKNVFTGGLTVSGAIDLADIIGYSTGANIKAKTYLKGLASSAYVFSSTTKDTGLGRLAFAGGVLADVAGELPAQTKTELALDLTVVSAFGSSYKFIKYPTRTGIGLYSGYKLFSGETIAEKGLGALGLFAVSPDIFKVGKGLTYKFSKDFVETKVGDYGIKTAEINLGKEIEIKAGEGIVKIPEEPIDIEFIPGRGFGGGTKDLDPLDILREDLAFKDTVKLPKTTPEQKMILDIVKQERATVSGSFIQQALIREARRFQDLDILSKEPKKLAKAIETKYSDFFKIEKKTITDSPLGEFDIYKVYSKKSGEHLADLDPIKFAEEGYAKLFEPIQVRKRRYTAEDTLKELKFEEKIGTHDELLFLQPNVRLLSKLIQSTRPLATKKRTKVALDIAQLTGKKELAYSPTLLRGYGLSKAQQKQIFLKGEFYSTHGGIGVIPRLSDEILLGGEKFGSPEHFFTTPSSVESGKAFIRLSRMGIGKKSNEATVRDLLKGTKFSFFGGRKQAIIEKGRLGDEFIQPNIMTSEIEIARLLPKEGTKLKIKKTFKTIFDGEPVRIVYAEKIGLTKINTKKLKYKGSKIIDRRRTDTLSITIPPKINLGLDINNKKQKTKQDTRINRLISNELRLSRISPRDFRTDIPIRQPPRRGGRGVRNRIDLRRIEERITPRTDRPIIRQPPRRQERDLREDFIRRRLPITRIKPTNIVKIKLDRDKKRKQLPKLISTYSLKVRRGGEFYSIGTDLSLGKAISLGTQKTQKTLARTFKIERTGRKKRLRKEDEKYYKPSKNIYRGFKIKKGKKEGLSFGTFIQKAPYALSTKGETRELQKFRREQKQINKVIGF